MADIVTLTMNPAVDISTTSEKVVPWEKLRCDRPQRDPGGGGVNVARAIRRLGGHAVAVFPAGGFTGQLLEELLDTEDVERRTVPIDGLTRESFTVNDRESGEQFRFVMPGPDLSAVECHRCLNALTSVAKDAKYIVASGSVPPGACHDVFARLAEIAHSVGARLIVDTSGESLRAALDQGVYLMKPNKREFAQITGEETDDPARQKALAQDLIDKGVAEIVTLTLGAEGAILVSREAYDRITPPEVKVRSVVGAGDSFLAGMTLGLARGWPQREAFRFGIAASLATLTTPGTALCQRHDTERLYEELRRKAA